MKLSLESRVSIEDDLYFKQRYGETLVVSPYNGTYVILSSNNEQITLLKFVDKYKDVRIKDLISTISEKNLYKSVSKLYANGLISVNNHQLGPPNSSQNYKLTRTSTKIKRGVYPSLCIFHIHDYCNFACKYCYTIDENKLQQKRISFARMKKVVDEIVTFPTKFAAFEFHGGEPLMAFDLVRETTEYANSVFENKKKKIFFNIQTNGSIINDRILKLFKDYNFSVRVSLDGPQKINDKYRTFKNGDGSYNKVIENLKILVKKGIYPDVVCVVNRNNLEELITIHNHFSKLKIPYVRYLPVFKEGKADKTIWVSGEDFFREYFRLIKHIVKKRKKNISVSSLNLLTWGELGVLSGRERDYMCMKCPCGAGLNMVAIDVDGGIFPCEEMIGNKLFKLGNIKEISIKDAYFHHSFNQFLRNRRVEDIKKCSNCTWRQFCAGGCIHKSYTHFNRLDRESEYCSYFKKIYEELIWLKVKEPKAWALLNRDPI